MIADLKFDIQLLCFSKILPTSKWGSLIIQRVALGGGWVGRCKYRNVSKLVETLSQLCPVCKNSDWNGWIYPYPIPPPFWLKSFVKFKNILNAWVKISRRAVMAQPLRKTLNYLQFLKNSETSVWMWMPTWVTNAVNRLALKHHLMSALNIIFIFLLSIWPVMQIQYQIV